MTPPDLPDIVALAVPFFILSMGAELLLGKWTGRARYDTRDTAASLVMGVGNLSIGIVFGFVSLGVLMWLYPYRLMDWGWSWEWFLLAFIIDDARYYVFHYLAHKSRWFWWGHITHHSSQHYNLSTALRQEWSSPWNLAFLLRVPLVLLLGMHPLMLAFLGGVNLVYQYWIHTEVIRRLPSPIEFLFNTPSHHRAHHGANPRYLDCNFGGTFIIWDRIMGTFQPELDEEPVRYGLTHNIATYNPLRIAFHELISIGRDATLRGIGVGDRLRYVFGPPGWSHDGSRKTAETVKSEWRAEQKKAEQHAQQPSQN